VRCQHSQDEDAGAQSVAQLDFRSDVDRDSDFDAIEEKMKRGCTGTGTYENDGEKPQYKNFRSLSI
jgi:hypothetical protein